MIAFSGTLDFDTNCFLSSFLLYFIPLHLRFISWFVFKRFENYKIRLFFVCPLAMKFLQRRPWKTNYRIGFLVLEPFSSKLAKTYVLSYTCNFWCIHFDWNFWEINNCFCFPILYHQSKSFTLPNSSNFLTLLFYWPVSWNPPVGLSLFLNCTALILAEQHRPLLGGQLVWKSRFWYYSQKSFFISGPGSFDHGAIHQGVLVTFEHILIDIPWTRRKHTYKQMHFIFSYDHLFSWGNTCESLINWLMENLIFAFIISQSMMTRKWLFHGIFERSFRVETNG